MKKLILFLLLILMWSVCVNAQTKFNEYYDWSTKQHKERLEDGEKYQMVYVDKYLIDKEHHKIYIFSSYDLYWEEELGIGYNFYFRHKMVKRHGKRKKNVPNTQY